MFKFLNQVFPGNTDEQKARGLYEAAVRQARDPAFYRDLGVPDSVNGRFDTILLHLFLIHRRLRAEGERAGSLAQTLFDLMVYDLDQSLRVSGVGDLKVGPKLRVMVESYYGRLKAYDQAVEQEDDRELRAAIARNLYAGAAEEDSPAVGAISAYLRREMHSLGDQDSGALLAGTVEFGPPPAGSA